jgi:hypothetical protein
MLMSLLMKDEVAKPVPGRDGYWITNFGRAFSNRPRNGKGALAKEFRELSHSKCSGGRYFQFACGKGKMLTHRAVALAFLGEEPEGCEVSHKDGNSFNNCADNLEYATHPENERMKWKHGTRGYGEKSTSHKLMQKQVDEIRERLKNYKRGMLTALAKEYGVCIASIHAIHKRKLWK